MKEFLPKFWKVKSILWPCTRLLKNISQNFLPPKNLFVEPEMSWMEREIVLIWMKLYLPVCCFLFDIFAV